MAALTRVTEPDTLRAAFFSEARAEFTPPRILLTAADMLFRTLLMELVTAALARDTLDLMEFETLRAKSPTFLNRLKKSAWMPPELMH
jgi:hypothetical protein